MARVVAALVAHDHPDLLREEVGRLALAFVAPLEPDDHRGRHQRTIAGCELPWHSSGGTGQGVVRAHSQAHSDVRGRVAGDDNAPPGRNGVRPTKKPPTTGPGSWIDVSRVI